MAELAGATVCPVATPTSCARAALARELHQSLAQARAELAIQRDAATEQRRELTQLRGQVEDERRASAQTAQAEAAGRASAAAAQAHREAGLRGVSEAARAVCDELMLELGHAKRDSDELRWALVQAMATVDSLECQLEGARGGGVAASGKAVTDGHADGLWGAAGDEATGATVPRGVACA